MNLADLRRPSLVRRLILLAASWGLLGLLIAGLVLTSQVQKASLGRFDEALTDIRENLYAGSDLREGQLHPPTLPDGRLNRVFSGRYWQIGQLSPNGRFEVLHKSSSLGNFNLKPPPGVPLTPGKPVFYDLSGPDLPAPLTQHLRATALLAGFEEDPARRSFVFMAAEDRAPVDRDARLFAVTAAVTMVLLGIGLIVAVLVQVRVGLQPLFALRREVAEVRKGAADRLEAGYPVELAPLAEELNALLAHNQEVVERQRTHVGNLAHALKTPLSVMLAEAQARPGPLADVVSNQAATMHEQVDHHLRRARTAARTQGQRERTAVAPVLDELAHTLERIFRDRGVTIDWRAPDDLCFQGERQDLLEIVGNVMENACKWSAGKVRVTAEPGDGQSLMVAVEDDGAGLPPERRDEVLKRGARLDEKTPGSGLGLAIVHDLARAYGGSLRLDISALGGLRVDIVLPRAES